MCKCGGVFQLFLFSPPSRRVCSVIFLVLCLFSYTLPKKIRIKKEIVNDTVQHYLMNFGYLPATPDGEFALRTENSIHDAIKDMQTFAGIPATGRLDEQTIKLLKTPRCGLPDLKPEKFDTKQPRGHWHRRRRFAVHGPKWPYTNLTWSLRSKNLQGLDIYEVRYVISKAFGVWSRHSKLTFTEVDSDKADILIYFYSRDHGDKFPFDGKGVILAHAFFPNDEGRSIDVHFDADEAWTTDPNDEEGTNLFNVAAHEFGHSLGLQHSSVEGALMYPWYKEMENGFDYELPDDDRHAIQSLYGSRIDKQWDSIRPYYPPTRRTTTTTTTSTTTTPRIPTKKPRYPYNPYNPNYHPYYPQRPQDPYYPRRPQQDPYQPQYPRKPMPPEKKPYYPKVGPSYRPTITTTTTTTTTTTPPPRRHGNRYPVLPPTNPDKHPDRRYHHHHHHHNNDNNRNDKETISGKKAPDTCDTSYDSIAVIRREVFIFKDEYFWRIGGENDKLLPGYPAKIVRLWPDLPSNLTHVDAVYERPDNKIVFFIDDQYYLFTGNRLDYGYPKPLTNLGLPSTLKKIDGAMVWGHNGKTYFYSGSVYWRFDEETGSVELDYPRDMSMWKGVGTDIDAVFQWKDGKTYFFKGKGFWKFNDQFMHVEHDQPKPSAPFWMGCSSNLEGSNDIGEKLPFKEYPSLTTIPSSSSSVHLKLSINNLVAICLLLISSAFTII